MAKEDKNFCCPDNFSVIIPYKDFVKLVEMGTKVDDMYKLYKQMCRQYDGMQQMFVEMLDKINEINRYL